MGQQTVAFQGTAPATSNPPGVTVIASIFLHYVEARVLTAVATRWKTPQVDERMA